MTPRLEATGLAALTLVVAAIIVLAGLVIGDMVAAAMNGGGW